MSTCAIPKLTSLEIVERKSVLPKDWRADFSDPARIEIETAVLEMIRRSTTRLPQDVIEALVAGRNAEVPGSRSANTLDTMLENVVLADERVAPLCQDTGSVIFWVRHPFGMSQRHLKAQVRAAVVEATKRSWLRPNCVEALSGKNPGNNLDPFGEAHPIVHLEEWDQPGLEIKMLQKGGGSENVGTQYRLPDVGLGAGRDLKGVRKCILDAVVKAQGQGCAPGILGVCIGGDRVIGFEHSKELLLRRLDQPNARPDLAEFERTVLAEANSLGIGPMGYGGRTTLLSIAVEELWRHPASFYVSISYMCWSSRRATLRIEPTGVAVFE